MTYMCVIYSNGSKIIVKIMDPAPKLIVKRVVKFKESKNAESK